MSTSFPKTIRLRKRREFTSVKQNKICLHGKLIKICLAKHKSDLAKLGICAPTRFGNSPERNRFKRLIREAFRLSYQNVPQGSLCIIYPKKNAKRATMTAIKKELLDLLHNASQP